MIFLDFSATKKIEETISYDYGEGNVTIHAGNVLWLDEVKLNY